MTRANVNMQTRSLGIRKMPALLLLGIVASAGGCEAPTNVNDDPSAQEVRDVMETLDGYLDEAGRSRCTVDIDGGPNACRGELEWQSIVDRTCKAHGVSLIAYKTFTDCGPGKHRHVAYACCPEATPPPPPPPPPGMCVPLKLGDPNVCRGIDEWKMLATKECSLKNLVLRDLKPTVPCRVMGSYSFVEAACCTSDSGGGGGGTSCIADYLQLAMCVDQASFKSRIGTMCMEKGLTLRDVSFGGTPCADPTLAREAKYTCCK